MVAPSPAVLRRREQEFESARTRAEVDELQRKWDDEDDAERRAQSTDVRRLAELEQKVRQLEQRPRWTVKDIDHVVVGPVGEVMGKQLRAMQDEFERRLTEVHQRLAEIEERGSVHYRGTWQRDEEYQTGAMVTHEGASWIAVGPATKGTKPGRDVAWRLAAKSGSAPSVA